MWFFCPGFDTTPTGMLGVTAGAETRYVGGLWREEHRGAPGFAGQLFAAADVTGGILRLRR